MVDHRSRDAATTSRGCRPLRRLLVGAALTALGAGAHAQTAYQGTLCADPGAQAPIANARLERVAVGFRKPVFVTGDAAGNLYVVEQEGTIRLVDRERGRPGAVFLSIPERVVNGGEMGLLSVALHPRYADNGRVFVNYTTRDPALVSRVSEFTADPGVPAADPGSERILLAFRQPYSNHNGGLVAFGPDGLLYVGTGDGGAANDPHRHGQRTDSLLGAMLRIDVDGAAGGRAYAIPRDNPFADGAGGRPELYAIGLRNPWRFSFDRATGTLYAGDVGQNEREEISVVVRGGNYGWRVMEGTICTPAIGSDCDAAPYAPPLIDYGHDLGYSVTGGYVYRGARVDGLCGVYLYGDYGSGRIWGLRHEGMAVTRDRLLLDTDLRIASFGEDADGEVYVVDLRGQIFRLARPGGATPPPASE